jgi:hypothetical protein
MEAFRTRAAFVSKPDLFRLLARIGEKKELVALIASEAKRKTQEPSPNPFLAPTRPRRLLIEEKGPTPEDRPVMTFTGSLFLGR